MTSIEWLEQIAKSMVINGGDLGEDFPALMVHIQQAKEMHQSEIEEAFYSGNQIPANWEYDSTKYYQETLKKDKS